MPTNIKKKKTNPQNKTKLCKNFYHLLLSSNSCFLVVEMPFCLHEESGVGNANLGDQFHVITAGLH